MLSDFRRRIAFDLRIFKKKTVEEEMGHARRRLEHIVCKCAKDLIVQTICPAWGKLQIILDSLKSSGKLRTPGQSLSRGALVESLLIVPVQLAQPHALPFRVIFEEHLLRRESELLDHAIKVLAPVPGESARESLLKSILVQEKAYETLAQATEDISIGVRATGVDVELEACRSADDPLKKILHLMNASALCVSGGGIRSASYSLGILEGLSRLSRPSGSATSSKPAIAGNLMDNLDYISSVSGGGYICSWMMSWVVRRNTAPVPRPAWQTSYSEVISALAGQTPAGTGHPPVTGGDPEPQPVRHLRSYTSFLAPDLGLTLDTFTLAAIVFRNLFINWTMLIPVLFALISLTKYSGFQFLAASHWLSDNWSWPLAALITIVFLLGAGAAAVALPSHTQFTPSQPLLAFIFRLIRRWAVCILLSSVICGSWLLTASSNPDHRYHAGQTPFETWPIALCGFSVISLSIFLAYRSRISGLRLSRWTGKSAAAIMAAIAALVCSAAISGVLYLLHTKIYKFLLDSSSHSDLLRRHGSDDRLFIVFALPFVLLALMLATSLFCALLGLYEMEEDREWWVRCGGCLLLFNLIWIVSHGIAFYGRGAWYRVIAGGVGLVLGMTGSAIGYSGATSAGPRPVKAAQLGTIGKFFEKHHLVLPVISAAALGLIALGAVAAEEAARMAILPLLKMDNYFSQDHLHSAAIVLSAAIVFAVSATLAILINVAININLFSLHGMYRMRLMRAFLGASNVFRHPDPFTNFDPKDTPHEIDLPSGPGAPLHIINTTLNLVGTRNTAWLQRKAESFTFSPICAGCWRLGYVPANIYGGSRGVTLATAMSISGAAFNPNMGYQSSPLLSLIMTFFNVRLGCWLPNPKRRVSPDPTGQLALRNEGFLHRSGPSFALKPLIADALGLTNDTSSWIELTDGGHFENLGLYEMVARRCKRIIVVDAGADPDFQFEDLGNAIRKIFIDLGVPIRFAGDLKMKRGMEKTNSYCAVAKIEYGCVDPLPPGKAAADMDGHLVYIKAGLTGLEPVDILQYAMTHPTFPHETTQNQFFNEAQFESYRHLGSYVIDCLSGSIPQSSNNSSGLDNFIVGADAFWSAK